MGDEDLIDEDPPELPEPLQVRALQLRRTALLQRVAEIETLLGFVATSEDLSVRVAAIERFVGIK